MATLDHAEKGLCWGGVIEIIAALHGLKLSAAGGDGRWNEDCQTHLYLKIGPAPEDKFSFDSCFFHVARDFPPRGIVAWLCDREVEKALSYGGTLNCADAASAVQDAMARAGEDERGYAFATITILHALASVWNLVCASPGSHLSWDHISESAIRIERLAESRVGSDLRCQALLHSARSALSARIEFLLSSEGTNLTGAIPIDKRKEARTLLSSLRR